MKHFGILEHATFYQGTPASDFKHGNLNIISPTDVDPELIKFGIQSALPSHPPYPSLFPTR